MVSGTRTLAMDPLVPLGWGLGLPSMGLVPARPADWDLGNLGAQSMPWPLCHVPRVIPEQIPLVWQGLLSY